MNTSKKAAINASTSEKARVSGVILVDKPKGLTSQQVVSKVKYLFKSARHNSKKAGHTGTLDPMATGLLPICLGEATKFSHYQLDADKSYEAVIQLGSQTDTGDADGQVIAQCEYPELTVADLEKIVTQFSGRQTQIPPMYSALKKDGKKLYEYARAGIEVTRAPRDITINQLTCGLLAPDKLSLSVTCSKGTYIRVLGEDIARALGTQGHLTALHRVAVGHFTIEDAISLAQLESLAFAKRFDHLLAIDACIVDVPRLVLDDALCDRLRLGQRINVSHLLTTDLKQYLLSNSSFTTTDILSVAKMDAISKDVRIVNNNDQFVGLVTVQLSGRMQPKKIINA